MSWIEEFQEAFNDYPSQDNEGFVPDRGGFKCGFSSAWHRQEERIRAETARADKAEASAEAEKRTYLGLRQMDAQSFTAWSARYDKLQAENAALREALKAECACDPDGYSKCDPCQALAALNPERKD